MDIYLNNNLVAKTSINGTTPVYFQQQKRVQDEVRGYLIYNYPNWSFVGCYQLLSKNNVKRVALILESPHKDEYDSNDNPLRPANGLTGTKINNGLQKRAFVNALNNNCVYEVYIINAIQYQTSCYSIFGKSWSRGNRNQVFRALFDQNKGNLEQDFINRITKYNPDIIVNACTSNLKSVVDTALNTFTNCNQYKDKHPSSW